MFFFSLSLGEKQHSPSDNPPSICQVNVRNICRPRESNLLPPNLHPFTRQVLSGKSRIKRVKELLIQTPTGEKRWKSKGCGVGKNKRPPHLYRVMDLPELKCINLSRVSEDTVGRLTSTHQLINSVTNWCEALRRGKWLSEAKRVKGVLGSRRWC